MTLYETIELDYPRNSIKYVYLRLIAIVIIILGIFLANTKRHSNIDLILANAGLVFLTAGVIVLLVSFFIAKPSKKALEEYWEILAMEEKIRNNILVLSEFNPEQHLLIETLNSEGYTQRGTMWQIYRRADLMEADAIIINSSNVTTHTHMSTSINNGSISTSSTNTDKFYITATLVKYKNPKDKPLTYDQQVLRNAMIEAIHRYDPKRFPLEELKDESLLSLNVGMSYITSNEKKKKS